MKSIDIREGVEEIITEIVFSEDQNCDTTPLACILRKDGKFTTISDTCDHVIIESKEHALNLIKALHKSIELGWVK